MKIKRILVLAVVLPLFLLIAAIFNIIQCIIDIVSFINSTFKSIKKIGFRGLLTYSLEGIIGGAITALMFAKPLPKQTNSQLISFMLAVWVFAISISWFGDSKTYMITCLSILGLRLLHILAMPEKPDYSPNKW